LKENKRTILLPFIFLSKSGYTLRENKRTILLPFIFLSKVRIYFERKQTNYSFTFYISFKSSDIF
jgi:hypothetical protein